jgi:hypothetical protein
MPEQRLVEERALGILASPDIEAAKRGTLALFRADRNARLANQDTLMRRSVDEHYFHAALMAAGETPRSPRMDARARPRMDGSTSPRQPLRSGQHG